MLSFNQKKEDEVLNKVFYRTLDYFIYKSGTTRAQIAVLSGLDISTLNHHKTDNGRWVSLGVFFRICNALEITPQKFINRMDIILNERN